MNVHLFKPLRAEEGLSFSVLFLIHGFPAQGSERDPVVLLSAIPHGTGPTAVAPNTQHNAGAMSYVPKTTTLHRLGTRFADPPPSGRQGQL